MRNFLRVLIKGGPAKAPIRHSGHDLAETVRDAIGPLGGGGGAGGGGGGGRMTGNAVYKHLEKTVGPNNPPQERSD